MGKSVVDFYDEFSEIYHLIFKDWDMSVKWHAQVIDKLVQSHSIKPREEVSIFDCSCGIGTQAIGLALLGYRVHGTDLSSKAIERARREARRLEVDMTFGTADFRSLDTQVNGLFDVVITCDNSLPHLIEKEDLLVTANNIRSRLKDGGFFLASIRDYDQLIMDRPKLMSSNVFDSAQERRIAFQVWDWEEHGDIYTVNQFVVKGHEDIWETIKISTLYRAISRKELKHVFEQAGFVEVTWHMPDQTGYYQPIITAIKR